MAAKKSAVERVSGAAINPKAVTGRMSVADLVDTAFLAYNGRRLRDACRLFAEKMLADDTVVGISLTGALTPAGLGMSCIIPLIENGFVDWMVSTGANIYHDTHFGLGLKMFQGSAEADDIALRKSGVVRIYDIFFDYRVLLSTDAFFREIARQPEFQRAMSTAEFHYLAGRYVSERERVLKLDRRSLLASAFKHALPVYTSSPGDSSIGMNLAALEMEGYELRIDPLTDVNETAAIVYAAKSAGMKSAVFILGGGSPKNFVLQTEPQIQEVMGVAEKGHDYFLQVTDARPDTGGLSGATPAEAVSWGKIDPDRLPDSVVCYVDSTVALPLITAYALARRKARKPRRLYEQRDAMMAKLKGAYEKVLRQRVKNKKS
ncbi:MAG: deoxyhypusine synthase [Candidatus Binataceae bacterium]|jgi:deoxyhypusine synthase|nr:deoxyhypusine synthase [Candidatus Binataceae bacterium]